MLTRQTQQADMGRSIIVVAIWVISACGRNDTSGLAPRGTHHVVRGTVTTSMESNGLGIAVTTVSPNPNGAFRLGNCVGAKLSDASGSTSPGGGFLIVVPSDPVEGNLCLVIEVRRSGAVLVTTTIPAAFFRAANVPPDTTTVVINAGT
ncbi:MAG: hypothetical protein WEE89_22275 [Gemmatimonadota bacterium]